MFAGVNLDQLNNNKIINNSKPTNQSNNNSNSSNNSSNNHSLRSSLKNEDINRAAATLSKSQKSD